MRKRLLFLGAGFACLIFNGCGGGSFPTAPEAGSGSADLAPLVDKRLVLTQAVVVDSDGKVLDELCGRGAECRSDGTIFTSAGKYIIDECDGACPADDPRNEHFTWTLAGDELTLIDEKDNSAFTCRIVESSSTSLKLAIPNDEMAKGLAISMGAPSHPETVPDVVILQTWTIE